MSFAKLKQNRSALLEKMTSAAKEAKTSKSFDNPNEWKPTVDKAGNGYAVIRFLPPAEDADHPGWVEYYDHGFKGPTGRWFFEKCRTTLGDKCPCCEANTKLWNSGIESNKDIVRDRKRSHHIVANIYVVSDPANPENEGKVFIYQFGKKIYDKIMDKLSPQFEAETPVNPFDFWEGCNFKMKIRNIAGFRNYDESQFEAPTPLLNGDDAALEGVYNQLHDISEYIDPSTFSSYAEVQTKLIAAIGAEEVHGTSAATMTSAPAPAMESAPATAEETLKSTGFPADDAPEDDIPFSKGADSDVSYFADLLKD